MAKIFKHYTYSQECIVLNAPANAAVLVPEENLNLTQQEPQDEVRVEAEALFSQSAYEQGFSEGSLQEKLKGEATIQQLTALISSIPEAIAFNRLQLQEEVAYIVLLICQQLFISQQHNKEYISTQVQQILNEMNANDSIELCLHPKDIHLLQQGELELDLKSCKNIQVSSDEGLKLGGAIIKSQHGNFDISIERQIDQLKHLLLQIKEGS